MASVIVISTIFRYNLIKSPQEPKQVETASGFNIFPTLNWFRYNFIAFLEYPAATKNHHEFVSGLAYHVVSMLQLAKAIAELYPSLNRDLLYAGVILHDLGKVIELSGPVSASYTIQGNLLGHISIMVSEIGKMAEEMAIEGEEVMLLNCYSCKWSDGEGGFCKYTDPERYNSCNYDKSGWETREEEECEDIK